MIKIRANPPPPAQLTVLPPLANFKLIKTWLRESVLQADCKKVLMIKVLGIYF